MSIQSEINRISGNVADALDAIEDKGVTVPAGSNSDDLADLIAQITGGGGGGIVIDDTLDAAGGIVRTITATPISGTKTITQNGVEDVAEYASVDVQVPSSGGTYQAKTNVAPSTSSQTITPDAGYDALSSVQINAMPSGTAGTPTATKSAVYNNAITVTPSVTNTAGYISSGTKNGTAVTVTASEVDTNTLYCDDTGTWNVVGAANFVVDAGTVNNPTAAKSAVSNHSVSVTPSVTVSEGWIKNTTKTGTAVTVSASELVSGSETKTANGTYDVTNLAELVVNVASSGKAAQIAAGFGRVANTAYTAVSGQSITVGKTGTYDVYWVGYRSSTSGTNGSQLYVGNTAHSSGAQTTFDATYTNWQIVHLSNVSLTKDQVVTVRARSRGTSYYMYIANFTIIEA